MSSLSPVPRGRKWRVNPATAAAVAAGGALGCAVAFGALTRVDIEAEVLGVASGSAGTVLATLAGHLFLRRARRTGAVLDVVLTASVTLLALVSLALALIAGIEQTSGEMSLQVPVTVGAGLVISAGFALAAFAPNRPMDDPAACAERLFAWGIAMALAMVAVVAFAVQLAPANAAMTAGDLIAAGLWIAASVGFVRHSRKEMSLTLLWLSVASAVIGVGQFSDALLPWVRADDLSGGDLIQIAGMVALLVAGVRDFEWDHRRRADTAVVNERRRLARELHDGLAQELAYIASHVSDRNLAEAAGRALEESRAAILALSRPADEPLERIIADTAHSIGARAGVDVTVAVRPGVDAPAPVKEALVRILRESMGNAIRHGRATTVRVSVDGPSPLVMVVADDGAGFDAAAARRPDSIGLQSMEDRTENLGGRMTIDSQTGGGTRVAVVIP